MQIVEPTEKAYVLSDKEKETLKSALDIFDELYANISSAFHSVELYSSKYDCAYTCDEINDIRNYLDDFVNAEEIVEKS